MEGTRRLRVALTVDETVTKGQALVRVLQARDQKQQAMKDAAAEAKAKLAELEHGAHELADDVRLQSEYREVDIIERPELESRSMVVYRCDTGERVESRAMHEHELIDAMQTQLPLGGVRVDAEVADTVGRLAQNFADGVGSDVEIQVPGEEPVKIKSRKRKGATVVDKTQG